MNKILLFIFLTGGLLYSQSFTMTCDATVKYGTPGTSFEFHPQLNNLTGNTINVYLARRLNQLPNANWSSSLCWESCFPSDIDTITTFHELPLLSPFETVNLTVYIYSDPVVPGTALVTVAVVDSYNISSFQQMTFTASTVSTSIDQDTKNSDDFKLISNYPNPFNPTTTINYSIPASGGSQHTRLIIYNSLGQTIRTLVNDVQIPGLYNVQWDGRDEAGHQVSSGVYLYRLSSGSMHTTKKMVLTR